MCTLSFVLYRWRVIGDIRRPDSSNMDILSLIFSRPRRPASVPAKTFNPGPGGSRRGWGFPRNQARTPPPGVPANVPITKRELRTNPGRTHREPLRLNRASRARARRRRACSSPRACRVPCFVVVMLLRGSCRGGPYHLAMSRALVMEAGDLGCCCHGCCGGDEPSDAGSTGVRQGHRQGFEMGSDRGSDRGSIGVR